MDNDIDTIAQTIIWLGKERFVAEEGHQDLISAVYSVKVDISTELMKFYEQEKRKKNE